MSYYFHDKRKNRRGYLIIHEQSCPNLPSPKYRKEIGRLKNPKKALDLLNRLYKGKGIKFAYCQQCLKPHSSKDSK